MGMLKILELRKRSQDALGESFNIEEFHHVILGGGALPFAILERNVDQWIAGKKMDTRRKSRKNGLFVPQGIEQAYSHSICLFEFRAPDRVMEVNAVITTFGKGISC
ncbi:MAG: DUF885 family protein [Oligoflexus sp.]|nr:DUF885 family protein [Oligoflexus sp.]